MDESRFTRLELRVDEIKDEVSELKAESKLHNKQLDGLQDSFNRHITVIEKHVLGDEKIISKLEPLMPQLQDMINDHNLSKANKVKRNELIKDISIKATAIGGIIAVITGFWELFKNFKSWF